MEIETERLKLRRLSPLDAEDFFRVVGDPEVMKYWALGPDEDVQRTEKRIAEINGHWDKHGFGDWGVFDKTDGRLIGFSGLHYIAGMAEVNLGYAFKSASWGRGLAHETCRAVLDFGFRRLKLPEIVAVIWPDNQASIRLAKACGLKFWKSAVWGGGDRVIYKIDRDRP